MNYEEMMELMKVQAKYELMKQELLNRYTAEERAAYEQGQRAIIDMCNEINKLQQEHKGATAFNQFMNEQLKESPHVHTNHKPSNLSKGYPFQNESIKVRAKNRN